MNHELVFGWEEWISLPKLGLPAIKAKIDTGARTSSLHALEIETFGPNQNPHVRFMVHPVPGRTDLVIPCSAPIVDRREITSSNGESELRYVIETVLSVSGRTWPIEVTLTIGWACQCTCWWVGRRYYQKLQSMLQQGTANLSLIMTSTILPKRCAPMRSEGLSGSRYFLAKTITQTTV